MTKKNNSFDWSDADHSFSTSPLYVTDEAQAAMPSDTFLYKGFTYECATNTEADGCVRVKELTLSMGSRSVSLGTGPACLFLPEQPEQRRTLEVSAERAVGDNDFGGLHVAFHLYREGTARALVTAEWSGTDGDDILLTILTDDIDLTPADYFLLCEPLCEDAPQPVGTMLGGSLCLPFRLLSEGSSQQEHPALQSATACRPKGCLTDGPYTSGPLQLRLCFDRLPAHRCELSAVCYTGDWNPMGEAQHYLAGRQGRRLTLRFCTDRIWMAGDYFAVIRHNLEPFACVSFRYDGRETTVCQCRPLTEADDEYGLVKHLETGRKRRWNMVRTCVGLGRIKPQLARMARLPHLNSLCDDLELEPLKTSVCRVVLADHSQPARRVAYALPMLAGYGTEHSVQVNCEEWVDSVPTAEEALKNREGNALTLYRLSALCSPAGAVVLERLVEAVCCRSVFWVLILCGSRKEVEALFAKAPQLADYFPESEWLVAGPSSVTEKVHLVQECLAKRKLSCSPAAEQALAEQVARHRTDIEGWDRTELDDFVCAGIVPRLRERLQTAYGQGKKPQRKDFVTVLPDDVRLADYLRTLDTHRPASRFEQSMQELNDMVGLSALKESLAATFLYTRFEAQRQQFGLPVEGGGSHHMIFTGNPGTGKSTVAALIGKIYYSMGLLSKGHVVSTERHKLVGRYIGETETRMNELLKEARGNVLFIDEAYTLCDTLDDRKDYGNRVVESLLTLLAQPRPDMLVILAGYADEMERLMQMNAGLKSRFTHRFHFDDYTAGELLQIADTLLQSRQYVCTPDARRALETAVRRAVAEKDRYFGNARWVHQLVFSGILPAMACRVAQEGRWTDKEALCTVTQADVEQAVRKCCPSPSLFLTPRRRIGFTA